MALPGQARDQRKKRAFSFVAEGHFSRKGDDLRAKAAVEQMLAEHAANRVATRLVKTGAQPTWAYGVEAYGLSAAALGRLRAATAKAVAPGGSQNCPIIAIRAAIGADGDPLAVATRASVPGGLKPGINNPRTAQLSAPFGGRSTPRSSSQVTQSPTGRLSTGL